MSEGPRAQGGHPAPAASLWPQEEAPQRELAGVGPEQPQPVEGTEGQGRR